MWVEGAAGAEPAGARDLAALLAGARAGDRAQREELLAACRPFVARIACQEAGRPLRWENDDELSVALIALNEAIDLFDPAKGAFLGFARLVIKRRLVDHFRREGRQRSAPLDADVEVEDRALAHLSCLEMARQEEAEVRGEELQELARELAAFEITLADLWEAAPARLDARRNLVQGAAALATDPVLLRRFYETRQVPLNELADRVGVSRKTLERGRKYMIALTIILDRGLFFLKEYLKPLLKS